MPPLAVLLIVAVVFGLFAVVYGLWCLADAARSLRFLVQREKDRVNINHTGRLPGGR